MKPRWLDRHILQSPYLTLCTTSKMFKSLCKQYSVDTDVPWISKGCDACAHLLESEGRLVAIVCIRRGLKRTSRYALLAHEAYHVVSYGWESYPGMKADEELVATALQLVTDRLIAEYIRQESKSGKAR